MRILAVDGHGGAGKTTFAAGLAAALGGVQVARCDVTAWSGAPREVCLARGVERDGEHMRPQWEAWLAAEDAYIARESPLTRADLVVQGV